MREEKVTQKILLNVRVDFFLYNIPYYNNYNNLFDNPRLIIINKIVQKIVEKSRRRLFKRSTTVELGKSSKTLSDHSLATSTGKGTYVYAQYNVL